MLACVTGLLGHVGTQTAGTRMLLAGAPHLECYSREAAEAHELGDVDGHGDSAAQEQVHQPHVAWMVCQKPFPSKRLV